MVVVMVVVMMVVVVMVVVEMVVVMMMVAMVVGIVGRGSCARRTNPKEGARGWVGRVALQSEVFRRLEAP